MKRQPMIEQKKFQLREEEIGTAVLLGLFIVALSSCATPGRDSMKSEGMRNPSSEKILESRECIRSSLEEMPYQASRHHRERLSGILSLTRRSGRAARSLEKLNLSEYQSELQRALIESHLEGTLLVAEFQKHLQAGKTLETIHQETEVYSRLQALRLLKESLEGALRETIEERVHRELRQDFHADQDGFVSFRWAGSWEERLLNGYHASAKTLEVAPEVVPAAFSDVQPRVQEYLGSASRCFEVSLTETGTKTMESVASAAESLQRSGLNARALKKISRNHHRSVVRPSPFVAAFAKEMEEIKREERSTVAMPTAQRVHYPDVGTPGNITGNTFPQGAWAITYDDGPGSFTATLLDQLADRKTKVSFFILTDKLSSFPKIPERMVAEGHSVSSHSYSHPVIPKLDSAGRNRQISEAVRVLESRIGEKTRFYRLPFGSGVGVASVRQLIRDAGLIHVFWNVDTLDWQIKTIEGIVENTQKQITNLGPSKNRGVILFHDVHERTVGMKDAEGEFVRGASLRVIDTLGKNPEVRFVTLPEVVDELNQSPVSARPER